MDVPEQSPASGSTNPWQVFTNGLIRFWPIVLALLVAFFYLLGLTVSTTRARTLGMASVAPIGDRETLIAVGGACVVNFLLLAPALAVLYYLGRGLLLGTVRLLPSRAHALGKRATDRLRSVAKLMCSETFTLVCAWACFCAPGWVAIYLVGQTQNALFGAAPANGSLLAVVLVNANGDAETVLIFALHLAIWIGIGASLHWLKHVRNEAWKCLSTAMISLLVLAGLLALATIRGVFQTTKEVPLVAFDSQDELFGAESAKRHAFAFLGETDADLVLYCSPVAKDATPRGVYLVSRSNRRYLFIGGQLPFYSVVFGSDWWTQREAGQRHESGNSR